MRCGKSSASNRVLMHYNAGLMGLWRSDDGFAGSDGVAGFDGVVAFR